MVQHINTHHFDKLFVDIKGNRSFKEDKKVVLWMFVMRRMHIFPTDTQICKLNQCLRGFYVYDRRLKTIEVEKYLAVRRIAFCKMCSDQTISLGVLSSVYFHILQKQPFTFLGNIFHVDRKHQYRSVKISWEVGHQKVLHWILLNYSFSVSFLAKNDFWKSWQEKERGVHREAGLLSMFLHFVYFHTMNCPELGE